MGQKGITTLLMVIFTGGFIFCAEATFSIIKDFILFRKVINNIELEYTFGVLIDSSDFKDGLKIRAEDITRNFFVDKSFLKSKHNKPPLLDIQRLKNAIREREAVKLGYHQLNYMRSGFNVSNLENPAWIYSISAKNVEILNVAATKREIQDQYFYLKLLIPLMSLGLGAYLFALSVGWVYYGKTLRKAQ